MSLTERKGAELTQEGSDPTIGFGQWCDVAH